MNIRDLKEQKHFKNDFDDVHVFYGNYDENKEYTTDVIILNVKKRCKSKLKDYALDEDKIADAVSVYITKKNLKDFDIFYSSMFDALCISWNI